MTQSQSPATLACVTWPNERVTGAITHAAITVTGGHDAGRSTMTSRDGLGSDRAVLPDPLDARQGRTRWRVAGFRQVLASAARQVALPWPVRWTAEARWWSRWPGR